MTSLETYEAVKKEYREAKAYYVMAEGSLSSWLWEAYKDDCNSWLKAKEEAVTAVMEELVRDARA